MEDNANTATIATRDLRISNSVYHNLPELIKPVVLKYTNLERDYFFSALLVALGSIMYKSVIYYRKKYNPLNLYFLGIGNTGRGKGAVKDILEVLSHVDSYIKLKNNEAIKKHMSDMKESIGQDDTSKSKKPKNPYKIKKFVTGSISHVRLIEYLSTNRFEILNLFGTEADSVSKMFKTEWGNFSSLLREAFHQDLIADDKKGEDRSIEVHYPLLSMILTGTPDQLKNLIKEIENGLFNRIIYMIDLESAEMDDPSPNAPNADTSEYLEELSKSILLLNKKLKEINGIHVKLTTKQWQLITKILKVYEKNTNYSAKLEGNITRLGLILVKFCSILTILRNFDHILKIKSLSPSGYNFSNVTDYVDVFSDNEEIELEKIRQSKIPPVPTHEYECINMDFISALKLARTYLNNAEAIISLYEKTALFFSDREEKLYSSLSHKFSKKEAHERGFKLGIPPRTIESFLTKWVGLKLIKRITKGQYQKLNIE
ncbi:MAG: DUF3987 domain-containing protein [Chitinophagales bacterium]|jgi:hypothetical protein